jgi:hypothetical protein
MGLAHFLGLLIGVQNPVRIGILGQNDWAQKPGKEFGPNMAFLDGLLFFMIMGLPYIAYQITAFIQRSSAYLYL